MNIQIFKSLIIKKVIIVTSNNNNNKVIDKIKIKIKDIKMTKI